MGRAFEELGWDVVSVDLDRRWDPTHVCNILDFEPEGEFDHVHASPPCQQYSIARTTAKTPRDLEGADRLVLRALALINRAQARNPNLTWTLENPATGLLTKRSFMQDLPFKDVSYCKYWNRPYRKMTRMWNNLTEWEPYAPCCKAFPCQHMVDGKHPASAQRMTHSGRAQFGLSELYQMPAALCSEIALLADRAARSSVS